MDIVILAHFCMDFTANDNGRFSYIADELSKTHSVEVVTSDFYHITKAKRNDISSTKYKITLLKEPDYTKNISLKRFYSHWRWGCEVKKYLSQRKKPDVVYCAVPSLTGPLAAAKYCERNNIRFIIDVQDLWPEAFKMVFNIPLINKIVFAPFKRLADGIYSRADEVVAVSDTYVQRALCVNNRVKQGHCVFLGTKLERFDSFARENFVDKRMDEFWLGYCGTLGSSYDLTCVIDALSQIREQGITPPKFIIMGDGPRIQEFKQYADMMNVECKFTGRLPYDKMCGLVSACDMVVNPISYGAAQSIINKHADYAACGRPVINTQECDEYRMLVETNNMGINCRNNSATDVAQAIISLMNDRKLCNEMGQNARRCAEEKFDREYSYCEILELFT